jgi:hypothetical protein
MPSDDSAPFDILALLDALRGVDFIIVGGVAATLHGGPRLTLDLDIVPAPSDRNVAVLFERLRALHAIVREPGRRRLPVSLELLRDSLDSSGGGQLRFRTSQGPLDVLWRLHDGRGYAELYDRTIIVSDDEREARIIGLADLIEVKASAGRPQDIEDVRYLTRIRARKFGG